MSNDVPIGTITAYGGAIAGEALENLRAAGWLVCNGESHASTGEFAALFAVIKNAFGGDGTSHFNVPDLRGRFLRGVNEGQKRDPDAAKRYALQPGGNTGDRVGSAQDWATKLPNVPFSTTEAGAHAHDAPHAPTHDHHTALTVGKPPHRMKWSAHRTESDPGGAHVHTISQGGDAETRPVNIYLHWLIKYKDPA